MNRNLPAHDNRPVVQLLIHLMDGHAHRQFVQNAEYLGIPAAVIGVVARMDIDAPPAVHQISRKHLLAVQGKEQVIMAEKFFSRLFQADGRLRQFSLTAQVFIVTPEFFEQKKSKTVS